MVLFGNDPFQHGTYYVSKVLEVSLWVVVSFPVGAGNQTQILCKKRAIHQLLYHTPSDILVQILNGSDSLMLFGSWILLIKFRSPDLMARDFYLPGHPTSPVKLIFNKREKIFIFL